MGKIKISTVSIPEDIKEENEDEKEVIVVEKNLKFDTACNKIYIYFPSSQFRKSKKAECQGRVRLGQRPVKDENKHG